MLFYYSGKGDSPTGIGVIKNTSRRDRRYYEYTSFKNTAALPAEALNDKVEQGDEAINCHSRENGNPVNIVLDSQSS